MNVLEEKGITTLDLHGEKHEFIEDIVIDFVYQYQQKFPLIIICGNSSRMINLVLDSLKKNNIKNSSPRYGIVRIEGFN
jgi:cobalamin biosynthesis Co2+ chelatase CbiK